MLPLNLTPIFKARGIEKPYTFLVKAGLSPHSAYVILNSTSRVFRLDHIELLCDVLNCEPNDLLMWTPKKGQKVNDNYPLKNLQQNENNESALEVLRKLTYKELRQKTKDMTNDGTNQFRQK